MRHQTAALVGSYHSVIPRVASGPGHSSFACAVLLWKVDQNDDLVEKEAIVWTNTR